MLIIITLDISLCIAAFVILVYYGPMTRLHGKAGVVSSPRTRVKIYRVTSLPDMYHTKDDYIDQLYMLQVSMIIIKTLRSGVREQEIAFGVNIENVYLPIAALQWRTVFPRIFGHTACSQLRRSLHICGRIA